MATRDTTRPPAAPPALPPTAYQDSGSDPGHRVQVTRNVPPKRVMVLPGNEVTYAGQTYRDGESFLHGEGATADQLAFSGHVVVVSHEEVDAWNGEEGEEIRKRGLGEIDALHKAEGTKRAEDNHHGFAKYEHADGEDAIPVDVTQHRQQLAQRHMLEGRHATPEDFGGKKGGQS